MFNFELISDKDVLTSSSARYYSYDNNNHHDLVDLQRRGTTLSDEYKTIDKPYNVVKEKSGGPSEYSLGGPRTSTCVGTWEEPIFYSYIDVSMIILSQ